MLSPGVGEENTEVTGGEQGKTTVTIHTQKRRLREFQNSSRALASKGERLGKKRHHQKSPPPP